MFVRTERLFLRPGWPEDVDELVDAVSGDAEVRILDMGAVAAGQSALRRYLYSAGEPRLPHFFMYLRAPERPQLVGGIGLSRLEGDVELGYWIASRHRDRGYAREAVRALLAQACLIGHRRVIANHVPDDSAMLRVLEETGFRDSGKSRKYASQPGARPDEARIFVADLATWTPQLERSMVTVRPMMA